MLTLRAVGPRLSRDHMEGGRLKIGALCWVVGLGLALAVPAPALAGTPVETPQSHAAADNVALTPQAEARLSGVSAAKNAAVRATVATVAGSPDLVGRWGPVVAWPVVAINAALLPNGTVLAYDSIGDKATETYPTQDHTRATVWDPVTGSQTDVTLNDGFNIFCSGFSFMANGSIFVAGGNKDQQFDGIVQTASFNWNTGTWTRGADMAYARWYPTVTAMGTGEMLITSGGPAIPEVRQTDGTLRTLSDASLGLPLYPWFDVAPDGRAFDSGPDQTMRSLDPTGAGAWHIWSSRDTINRDYGSHAMYDIGKILVAGGGPSTKTADVINVNTATPTVTSTGSMAYGRRQNNLTVLADGTVLVTGGNSSGAFQVDMNAGVYAAELWDPATGHWTTLSNMQVTRQYHSTALLLPDGRVLSAGGGICATCDQVGYLNKNAEIFSPPYLFEKNGSGSLAPRPTITDAPAGVADGYQFTVSTPDAASIRKVALVKLGAVTHSNNMDQRYVPLSFTAGSGTLTVTAPANVNIAPSGYYMLFIINSAGVPSVAPILKVSNDVPPSVQVTAPNGGSTFPLGSDITLNAAASDSDGAIQKVEWFAGTIKLGESSTAPYSLVWHPSSSGTYVLTARATDNAGVSTTSASESVGVVKIAPATITVPPLTPTAPMGPLAPATATITVPKPLGRLAHWLLHWKFATSSLYTRILSMTGTNLPLGTKIVVSCRGRRCPFSSLTVTSRASRSGKPTRSVDLTPQLRRARFQTGTSLTVGFIDAGFVGKVYRFKMRSAQRPAWSASCLASESLTAGRGC